MLADSPCILVVLKFSNFLFKNINVKIHNRRKCPTCTFPKSNSFICRFCFLFFLFGYSNLFFDIFLRSKFIFNRTSLVQIFHFDFFLWCGNQIEFFFISVNKDNNLSLSCRVHILISTIKAFIKFRFEFHIP